MRTKGEGICSQRKATHPVRPVQVDPFHQTSLCALYQPRYRTYLFQKDLRIPPSLQVNSLVPIASNNTTPPLYAETFSRNLATVLTALPAPEPAPALLADIHRRRGLVLARVDDALLYVGRERVEGLIDVDVALGRHLEEGDAQLVRQRLALLRAHRPLLLPVALVADQDLVDALGGVLLHVCEPGPDICVSFTPVSFRAPNLTGCRRARWRERTVERPLVRHIVYQQDAHGAPVIGRRDGAEAFLTRRIPDLELDALAVQLDGADLEVDADRGDEGWRERVLAEAQQAARLAYARVAD